MKIKFLVFLLGFTLMCLGQINAQNRAERAKDRAENRANQKIDNKINQKVDNAVDDAFNAIGGLFKKKKRKKKRNAKADTTQDPKTTYNEDYQEDSGDDEVGDFSSMFGQKWEPYTNPKSFSADWNMTTTKRNGKVESLSIRLAVVETQSGYEMLNNDVNGGEAVRMILDTKTGKTVLINTEKGESSGTRVRLPNMQAMIKKEMKKQQNNDRWKIEKTNEQMVIDGYTCSKYIITDSKTGDVNTSWVTTEAGLSWSEMHSAMAFGAQSIPMNSLSSDVYEDLTNGILIKSTIVSKKETTEFQIRNIKTGSSADTSILDVSGIEIIDTGF